MRPCLPPGPHVPHEPGSVIQSRHLDPRPSSRLDHSRQRELETVSRQHPRIMADLNAETGCDGANLRSSTVNCGPQDTDHTTETITNSIGVLQSNTTHGLTTAGRQCVQPSLLGAEL